MPRSRDILVFSVTSLEWKVGDDMPSGIEVTKAALDDFAKVQRRMLLAKKEAL